MPSPPRTPDPRPYALATLGLIVLTLVLPADVSPANPFEAHYVWTYLADMELPDAELRVASALVRVFVACVCLVSLLTRLRFPTIRMLVVLLLIQAGFCGVPDVMTALTYRPPFSSGAEMYAASAALAGLASLVCQFLFVTFLYAKRTPLPNPHRKGSLKDSDDAAT